MKYLDPKGAMDKQAFRDGAKKEVVQGKYAKFAQITSLKEFQRVSRW